ncbi:hypothetical protein FUA26_12205 [Seonamhaeicola algicola]|uniref:Type II secretion system protein GspG C-terminal domain-containing protein n=1 Tax=Seonamhaeicola algicola TaxID=1719036 RepID=A0A5C7AI40_9FLAO|nr:hypothetical protein [Seonamhaeicola algicola]TXE08091.1 hypothetical protein FUA26_12205 [Seonamhaeicola algicola]
MIQGILEIIADFWLQISDYNHKKKVIKKEQEDGKKRSFEKYFLQPSAKTLYVSIVVFGLAFYLFFTYQKRVAYPNKTKKEIIEITTWIYNWHNNYNRYPKDLKEAFGNDPIKQQWFTDAWKNQYKYKVINKDFVVLSAGNDGVFNTDDDIYLKK